MSKPEQKPTAEPRLPLRGLAMILLAIGALFIAWGVFMLSQGAETAPTETNNAQAAPSSSIGQATTAQQTPTSNEQQAVATSETQQTEKSSESPVSGNEVQSGGEPIHVLNNSTIQGLGQRVADEVGKHNFDVAEVGNHSETTFPSSVVYFTQGKDKEEKTARALADKLGITAAPRGSELENAPTGVVLVVTQDLNR
ncbi:LytR C-terminal domain-containing protein [Corynebacterium freiburgense]|uniref:LytR C-terminal domain-containing protein n=1 Tax=Corynebacterium freiburgense TaxID=556548 RepID=UPI0009FDC421|nr:LytR C-terminal domain-containing protein [Corynebacterium freiburgense]